MTRTRTIVRRTTKGVIKIKPPNTAPLRGIFDVHPVTLRARGVRLDAGDCRFAACGALRVKDFAQRGFGFFLLPNIIHTRLPATTP